MTAPTIPEGFTRHDGGECPVPLNSRPKVFLLDGTKFSNLRADQYVSLQNCWKHEGDKRNHIIGFIPEGSYEPDPNCAPSIDWQARAEKAEAKLDTERERCASIGYRICAETRHVTLGTKVAAAIRGKLDDDVIAATKRAEI